MVVGKLLAERLALSPGDTVRMLAPPAGDKINPVLGTITPRYFAFEVTGLFETGDVRVRQLLHLHGAAGGPGLRRRSARP